MDFERAAQRLQRDQSKLKGRRKVQLSASAAREAEQLKKHREKIGEKRAAAKRKNELLESYMRQCERSLGVKPLTSNGLRLKATSIHGEGDKIALPPSVLETLTGATMEDEQQQPWIFRIGVQNPNYKFPASPLLNDVNKEAEVDEESSHLPFLDEMRRKYLSFTHGTVVEFTQEEGNVGLPEPVATALLKANIPAKRTVDKAASDDDYMQGQDQDEKTPGHLAWGAFDVPDVDIEISIVKLPKGRSAKLLPTKQAIQNGFYNLKDVKLVLEQSLIRTRATLSVGDTIYTWHRGTKFDLTVTAVSPSTYDSVTCINTDIEIDFEPFEDHDKKLSATMETESKPPAIVGRRLDEATVSSESAPIPAAPIPMDVSLPPEPPIQQTEGVVTVQVRAPGGAKGQRRFGIQSASTRDLFAFAVSILGDREMKFRLVTRFPRRVFTSNDEPVTLNDAGIAAGQELFMIELF